MSIDQLTEGEISKRKRNAEDIELKPDLKEYMDDVLKALGYTSTNPKLQSVKKERIGAKGPKQKRQNEEKGGDEVQNFRIRCLVELEQRNNWVLSYARSISTSDFPDLGKTNYIGFGEKDPLSLRNFEYTFTLRSTGNRGHLKITASQEKVEEVDNQLESGIKKYFPTQLIENNPPWYIIRMMAYTYMGMNPRPSWADADKSNQASDITPQKTP